jgi:tRNA(Ile)-lysidine synthetase-like protein
VERAGGTVRVVRLSAPAAAVELTVPGQATFGAFAFDTWIDPAAPVAWPDGRTVAVLDADRAGEAFTVRAVERADRFRPLGRTGSKRVVDALREAGVGATERGGRPVLVDRDRNVCWVVGYRVADHVKVTARTRRHLWITVGTRHPAPVTRTPLTSRP